MKRRNLDKPKKLKQLKQKDIPIIRDKLLKKQGGLCAICKQPANRPCLDHEHVKRLKGSGRIRGVLCSNCNVFLAKMENNCVRYAIGLHDLPRVLKNVVIYIQAEHTEYIHPSEQRKKRKLKKASYNKFKKLYMQKYGSIPMYLGYPKSGKLVIRLREAYKRMGLKPEFYK